MDRALAFTIAVFGVACSLETSPAPDEGSTAAPNCGMEGTSEIEVPLGDVQEVANEDGSIASNDCESVCTSPFWEVLECSVAEDLPATTTDEPGTSGGADGGTAGSGTDGEPTILVSCTYIEKCI